MKDAFSLRPPPRNLIEFVTDLKPRSIYGFMAWHKDDGMSKEKITHKEQKVNKTEFSAFLYSAFFFFFTRSSIGSGNAQQFDSVASPVKQHGIGVRACWTLLSETSAFFCVEPEIALASTIRCAYFQSQFALTVVNILTKHETNFFTLM